MNFGCDSTRVDKYEALSPFARGGAPNATKSRAFVASVWSMEKAANACADPWEKLYGSFDIFVCGGGVGVQESMHAHN